MKRIPLAIVLLVGLLPALLRADTTSCSLLASSYNDSVVNPPVGEDTDFFVTTGGVPNVMFLIDTSNSMKRLPADGATLTWGSFETAGNTTTGGGYGCSNALANSLTFHSACGTTSLEGSYYSSGTDFGAATLPDGTYCPYMDQGNSTDGAWSNNRKGYDPDFYCDDATGTSCSGHPNFFAKSRVYHDVIFLPVGAYDGWSDWSSSPTTDASTDAFCTRVGGNATKIADCKSCMNTRGYWFDGSYIAKSDWDDRYLDGSNNTPSCTSTVECQNRNLGTCVVDSSKTERTATNNGAAHCQLPHVWFSGNFLNFYPPKFVIARKVLKDTIAGVKRFRMGLARFASSGASLVWDLNPSCNMFNSNSKFYNNRSSLLNAINNSNKLDFDNGTPLSESLLAIGQYYRSSSLPWFSNTYQFTGMTEKTGANQQSVCFSCQQSAIIVVTDGVPTGDSTVPGGTNPMTKAVADQTGSSKVYAGNSNYGITNILTADCAQCNTGAEAADTTLVGDCVGQQASGACDNSANAIQSYLPKVAWYLHNVDLRSDAETGADGLKMTGKQTLNVYTIGFGTGDSAANILVHTANMGGGLYNGGRSDAVVDAASLKDAIQRSLNDINTRATSFGAASLSTLQAAASQGVLIPRFQPSRSAHWNGHLYSFLLYSEFTGGCAVPTSGASGPGNKDFDCDGKCTSVFLRDYSGNVGNPLGDFIQENSSGAFVKNAPAGRAACGTYNQCTTGNCGTASTTAANPFWDAGDMLSPVVWDHATGQVATDASGNPQLKSAGSYTRWSDRKIYTVVDNSGDGKFTGLDDVIAVDDAHVSSIEPYLNLRGSSFCAELANRLQVAGNTPAATAIRNELNPTAPTKKSYQNCAKVVLQYVRGADIFNELAGCTTFPTTYCTRSYQLGDVFHSSPVEVWPPLPSDGLLCSRGLHSQCLPSLYSASMPNPAGVTGHTNAYDDYAKDSHYKHRNKYALVGANDGMLHAFLTGTWHAGGDDPATPQHEDEAPYEGYYDGGTGEELWAFIPPDLLPKLQLLLGVDHHYFVDATAMVRDVWIDGGNANKLGGATAANNVRQGNEFHTIAIVGERRGGTHYFALDVTDASNGTGSDGTLDQKPKFLWLYPQPSDPEQLQFGETYADFIPTPPPIGPVRLDAGAPPCADGAQTYAASTGNRCFTERWVVFLSGGFDPLYTRGRGVHMVAVDSGAELFDFSQPSGNASTCNTTTSDPRCHLNYPVAATVGMMMWGKQANHLSSAAVDGYFDTATFGDTGGQLWVLRFNDPGILASGKVTNWYGARVFQQNKTATSLPCGLDFCGSQPFFYITANVSLAANGLYRVLAGTGDRYNLLDQAGGTCGPDNLRACMLKGCTVKLEGPTAGSAGATYAVSSLLGQAAYHEDHPASCSGLVPSTYSNVVTAPSGASCTAITTKVDALTITCPAARTCSGVAETTIRKMSANCVIGNDSSGNPREYCEPSDLNNPSMPTDMKYDPNVPNWFFSIQVFENSGGRQIFTDAAGALAYDQARLTQTDLVDVNAADAAEATTPGTGTYASPSGKGWKYYYNHGDPNAADTLVLSDGNTYKIFRDDERTASNSAVEASCTFWNTMQVALAQGSLDATTDCYVNSPCKAGRSQVSYLYGASPSTGAKCLMVNGSLIRTQQSESLVPPHIGKLVAYVSSGQVSFGLTSVRIPQGGSNISLGEAQDIASPIEWLPVDKATHDCRHAAKTGAPTQDTCK